MKRRLPIGIQTFRKLREGGCYYVDKTPHIQRLVEGGTHYFLSRPRRFGKSLLLDTIKELFEGSEELFRGLAVHDRWDWSVRRPVVRLSFGSGDFAEPGYLHQDATAQLDAAERRSDLRSDYDAAPPRFRRLLEALHERSGRRVAVLVDEYDKPILDALDQPAVARANRDYLRGLYAVIKESDPHVEFTLLTGVSKFSKVSLFSGLNNLQDLTLDPRWSTLCGYTEADIDTVFAPELAGLDRAAIRDWYNGYSWSGDERVYNPFDVLLLFDSREFRAHWFETGSPAFLVDTLVGREVPAPALDRMVASDALLSAFDVGAVGTEALLFQTGYLTIRGVDRRRGRTVYRLGYPNREVRQSLNESLLARLAGHAPERIEQSDRLADLLEANDWDGLQTLLGSIFAGIPYQWHTRNDIADYEGYYASIVYSLLAMSGLDVSAEESSSRGRADMAVRTAGGVYLIELKVAERTAPGAAMRQLRERGYADRYRHLDRPIHLLAVEFSRETRGVVSLEVQPA